MTIGLKANVDGSGAVQTNGVDAIQISTSQAVTFPNTANLPNTFGFKNRIINGDMRIDQRNAGASITPTFDVTYTVDRWSARLTVASKYSVQRNAASVTPPAGFTNYLGVTSLAATTVAAGDYYAVQQTIEGFNIADLAWGTASAAPVTISFWVRSSLTGTFGGALGNSSFNRSYPFTYTISAANTWEQKTITIAGDTSGTWLTNNGSGISLYFGLGIGSTYSGTAGSWASANYLSATGATSVVGTNGATFYITGIQLERGSIATSFDYLDYGRSLIQCQRYYYRITPGAVAAPFGLGSYTGGTTGRIFNQFPCSMRAAPTALEQNGTAAHYDIQASGSVYSGTAVPAFSSASTEYASTTFTVVATLGTGAAVVGRAANATAYLGWSAEI